MITEWIAGKFSTKNTSTVTGRLTDVLSVPVAQVELPGQELCRAGRRYFIGNSAAATGIAPVQAIPTTAAQWALWNTDSGGGVTAYFEELGELLASGTPGLGGSVWACLFTLPASTGSNATGLAPFSASGSSRGSKILIKSGVTISTPAAPGWFQLAESADSVTAAAFSTGYANGLVRRDLAGAIAIPPQTGLGLAFIAPTGTTPLYIPQARWVEVETVNME